MEVLKKALVNRKKLANSENEKYQLGSSIESFISENLSRMKDNIGFEAIKLRRTRAIHGWFTRDGVIHIKLDEMVRSLKFSIKLISLSTAWIMKRKGKIYFMMCVTGSKLLCSVQLFRKFI